METRYEKRADGIYKIRKDLGCSFGNSTFLFEGERKLSNKELKNLNLRF